MLFFKKRGKDGGGTGEGRILLVCLLLVARAGDRLHDAAATVLANHPMYGRYVEFSKRVPH